MALKSVPPIETQNGNFRLEGYSTGRNVVRSVDFKLTPGATPNTNINIVTGISGATFNIPSITDATDLAASGSSGSFALSSNGKDITFDITEDIVGVLAVWISGHDMNSSTAGAVFFVSTTISSSNLIIRVLADGSQSLVDWRTILDTGDQMDLFITFVTSS